MDREQIEIRYLEILNEGGNPMDDADIRRAVEEEPALEAKLASMGSMIEALADASWPEGEAPMTREPIDAITKAFEEGLQQGRRAAIERPARRGVPAWIPTVAVAATVTAFVIGTVWQTNLSAPNRQATNMPQATAPMEEQVAQSPAADRMMERTGADQFATVAVGDDAADPVVALLAENSNLKQTVAKSLLESGSPAQRMQGLEYTAAIDTPDDDLIDALSNTLRTDESVTVRLATAETLNRYGSLPTVRNTIIDALLTEKDPLVQLQLIDLLMDVRDAETLKALRSLEQNPDTDALVRQRVEWALKESR